MNHEKKKLSDKRDLIECFEGLPDPRKDRMLAHKLIDILVIGLCSTLVGGEGFTDMETFGIAKQRWLKRFLELPNGIPSHDTFNRVFSSLDPSAFLDCFVQWVQGLCTAISGEVVAIDGKALRRASNNGASIPYIVSAWATENGLVLGQVKVDEKSNEITAIPELLRVLELKGCIVTIDAMGCQKEIAAKIVDKSANYVLALKGNHGIAKEEIQAFFSDAVLPCANKHEKHCKPDTISYYKTAEKNHGRIETRRYWQSTDINWFEDKVSWKQLQSLGMVESIRKIKGIQTVERRYYLTSLPLDAVIFAKAVRGHWGVENPLHWTLDVTFREDNSRARTKNAAQNLATLRRIVLNLLKKDQSKKFSLRGKRFFAALNTDFFEELLGV